MEIYSNAIKTFKVKKYDESKKMFLESLRVENLSNDQILNCIKNIKSIESDKEESKLEFEIANELFSKNKTLVSKKLLDKINFQKICFKSDFIFLFIDVLEKLGEIQKLELKVYEFINYLIQYKRLNILIKLKKVIIHKNKK